MAPRRKRTRGYPVAALIGIEAEAAYLWQLFSKAAKLLTVIQLEGNRTDAKSLYNFHESIINSLRQTLKEGVRSVVIASPPRTDYSKDFMTHVGRHHAWLMQGENKIAIAETTSSAATTSQVAILANSPVFRQLIRETTFEETDSLLGLLEKRLSTSNRESMVLFSVEEAENLIFQSSKKSPSKLEYILLTDEYLKNSREKNRLHRLLQIASNKRIKTRVVDSESAAGQRIAQLGGFVCLTKPV